ncbi:MAG: indoleacetamide hydrolase [Burkholderiales bacterium]|nr:indoleacetamide hydrolase [Burkholderiales bacterium]
MEQHSSRRTFLKTSGAVAATSLIGVAVSGCGGSGDDDPTAMTTAEQLALTSSQAIAAMRAGSLSAETYVTTLLARAEALNELNAFITLNKAGALTAARAIDAMRTSGTPLPALAGLPIVVKDNINTRDLPTSGGTLALRNVQPTANAPSLQKLIDAGAIVLGKTNMHELAFGITSTNLSSFAGPVKNPYDKTRIPGGSSGGTAAAIAARIAPSGIGTDTGGSSRLPAALCGIVGLRPSVGNGGVQRRYTDTNAVVPISHTRDTVGPMGRTVADVALLDSVITGRAMPAAIGLKGLRIGIPASFWAGLDTQLAAVMTAAKTKLAAAGMVLVDVDTVGLMALNDKVSFPVALHEPIADIPAYLAATGVAGVTVASIAAQIASPDVKGAFGAILGDVFGSVYADAINIHRPQLQALYASYFADNALDAMMFPTSILPAVVIDAVNGSSTVSINGGAPVDEFGTYIRNTDPGSNAGIPGLSLPAGLTSGGLPVGLELDGPVGSDARLLGMGLAIEDLLGTLAAPAI